MKAGSKSLLWWIGASVCLAILFASLWTTGAKPERDQSPERPPSDGKLYRVHQAWLGWHDVEGKLTMPSNPFHTCVITLVLRNADGWLLQLARQHQELRGTILKPEELEAISQDRASDEVRQRFTSWFRDRLGDLRLVIAGQRFETIRPADTFARGKPVGADTWHAIVFRLSPESAENAKWQEFIRLVGVQCSGRLTVALPLGGDQWASLHSEVNDAGVQGGRFEFNLRPALMTALAKTLVAAVWFLLIGVALSTDALRAERPPGLAANQKSPWSLARVVLAWWLGICASAYLFLWAMTDELNVLSGSGPLLLGINGGTLLFARFLNARNSLPTPGGAKQEAEGKPMGTPVPGTSPRGSGGFMRDLISEGGEPEISRVQMLVWNALLGVVFVWQTLVHWKMPTFDATLMTLLGISATTYLGFKAAPASAPA